MFSIVNIAKILFIKEAKALLDDISEAEKFKNIVLCNNERNKKLYEQIIKDRLRIK